MAIYNNDWKPKLNQKRVIQRVCLIINTKKNEGKQSKQTSLNTINSTNKQKLNDPYKMDNNQ